MGMPYVRTADFFLPVSTSFRPIEGISFPFRFSNTHTHTHGHTHFNDALNASQGFDRETHESKKATRYKAKAYRPQYIQMHARTYPFSGGPSSHGSADWMLNLKLQICFLHKFAYIIMWSAFIWYVKYMLCARCVHVSYHGLPLLVVYGWGIFSPFSTVLRAPFSEDFLCRFPSI